MISCLVLGFLFTALSVMGFQYQNNDVEFTMVGGSLANGVSLLSLDYTILAQSITAGQDPNNNIYFGETLSGNSSLRFVVGRQGSTDVADFWEEHFHYSDATFDKFPGELNFAVDGDLYLHLQGGPFSQPTTVSFNSVGLAQGHHDNSNNWWFAVWNAATYHGPSGKDESIAVWDDTGAYQFAFYRGHDCSTDPNKYESLIDCGTNPDIHNADNEVRIELIAW